MSGSVSAAASLAAADFDEAVGDVVLDVSVFAATFFAASFFATVRDFVSDGCCECVPRIASVRL